MNYKKIAQLFFKDGTWLNWHSGSHVILCGEYVQIYGYGVPKVSFDNAGRIGTNGMSSLPLEGRQGGINTLDIDAYGSGRAKGGWISVKFDLAEIYEIDDKSLEYGDVVVIDPNNDIRVTKSSRPYDTSVIGVISKKPGFVLGDDFGYKDGEIPQLLDPKDINIAKDPQKKANPNEFKYDPKKLIVRDKSKERPVALIGRTPVKVTTSNGKIRRGDLLTTSSKPGYAMKAIDPKIGTVIGKALESLDSGDGKIQVFINIH